MGVGSAICIPFSVPKVFYTGTPPTPKQTYSPSMPQTPPPTPHTRQTYTFYPNVNTSSPLSQHSSLPLRPNEPLGAADQGIRLRPAQDDTRMSHQIKRSLTGYTDRFLHQGLLTLSLSSQVHRRPCGYQNTWVSHSDSFTY